MKTRDTCGKVLGVRGLTLLACGLWLLASYRDPGRRGHEAGARAFPVGTNLDHTKQDSQWREAYGKLPLSFEENVGQTAQEVRYVSRGAGYELFLTPREAVVALRTPVSHDLSPRNRFKTMRALREGLRARTMTAIRMRFEGANPAAQISATDRLPKKTNYFIGSDPTKWHADVPSYSRVKYAGIYPGVDLVFYGNHRGLEYDFVVAPGADPQAIRLALKGARKLRISERGDVILSVPGGELVLQKPVVYQMVGGVRREIAGSYALAKNHQVTFSVPSYDRTEPLILDPVLNYSTYLGGLSDEGGGGSQSFGIAVDANGNAFVAGTTFSNDFPTTPSGFNAGPPASGATFGAVFVTEMNPTGTAEVYSTYLAGSTGEFGVALAMDPAGKIYITGLTFSDDFPTTDGTVAGTLAGFKQSPNPTNLNVGTSFLSKIDPSKSGMASLVYSSYIGGTGATTLIADFGNAIAVDADGNAYVTGITLSPPNAVPGVFPLTDFPVTANAFQPTPSDVADGNAFLTRIDTTQSGNTSLIYSTYLGGAGANAANLGYADAGFGVAVDSLKNAYIVGSTASTDFPMTSPTPNGFQTTSPAGNTLGTGFLAKIDTTPGGGSLIYSTFLGGEASDIGVGVALGPNNVAYATGGTKSLLFPTTTGAFETTGNSHGAAFLSLVDTGQSGNASLLYSTFLGGTGADGDTGNAIQADGAGNAYVVGSADSTDFPVTPGAFEPVRPPAAGSGFVAKLNPGGHGPVDLVYSTFFGGSGDGIGVHQEQVLGVALDSSNPPNAYITGQTFSSAASFPIFPAGAFQTTLKGTSDAFIAKLTLIPTFGISPTSLAFGVQPVGVTSLPKTVTLTNNTSDPIPFPGTSVSFTGTNAADFGSPSNTCGASIAAGASCTVSVTFTPSVASGESATLVITVVITNGGLSSSQLFDVSLGGTGSATAPGVGLSATSLTFAGQLLTTTSASKPVTLTNNGATALTINSIAASGDFAETNTCGTLPATLAANANCTISVTFAPTTVGARTGTLTVTDNAGGSPHTVSLTGTGWDFTLTAPATVTVKKGSTGSFNVTITPLGGFNQAVTVTCTGTTMPVTCTPVSPVTPADGVTPVTSAVSISAMGMTLPPPSTPTPPVSIRQIVPLLLALLLFMFLYRTRRLETRLGMVTAIIVLLALSGCSDNSKVKKGTTNLTITASSGGVNKTATVALTID